MRLAEKGGLPLEMCVLCRSSLKKQVSNSYKGKVECAQHFVMLIEVSNPLENLEHNEHWECGPSLVNQH